MSQGRGDWHATCSSILKKVEDQLGQSLSIFNAPVDVKIYPEYAKYVDKPMDLGTIRGRLEKGIYRDPQEFCNVSPTYLPLLTTNVGDIMVAPAEQPVLVSPTWQQPAGHRMQRCVLSQRPSALTWLCQCWLWHTCAHQQKGLTCTVVSSCRDSVTQRPCASPQDMRQVWENCFKFNKKDTFVGKVGSKADEKFEQLWAGSGYDQGGRRRRVTGGVAAHRYEPDLLEAEPKASMPRRTSSGGRSSRRVRTLETCAWHHHAIRTSIADNTDICACC